MNYSKSSKTKTSLLTTKHFKNKQTNTENVECVDKCMGITQENVATKSTYANNDKNEYDHEDILLEDYVKAMNYINSCHSIINEMIQARTPGSAFSMPRLPNFLSAYTIINKGSKETIQVSENMDSLDEMYSRNDSFDINVINKATTGKESRDYNARTNGTDSDIDPDSRALTDCNDLAFSTDDDEKKIIPFVTKSRTSNIPRPVSSERCYRPKSALEDETPLRQSNSISQVIKTKENKKSPVDKSVVENKPTVTRTDANVAKVNPARSRLRPSSSKDSKDQSVSRRKLRDANSKSPNRTRVSSDKVNVAKTGHLSRANTSRSSSESRPELGSAKEKIIVARPYSSKQNKPDLVKNKVSVSDAKVRKVRDSSIKRNENKTANDQQKTCLNSSASIRHIQQKLAETDLNCNEGLISQDDLEKFANELISSSNSTYDSPTSRSMSPSSPKPYKSSSKSKITYKTKSEHNIKPLVKSKSKTCNKVETKNLQKHRKTDLIEKLSAMIDKVETTERGMKLKHDTAWRQKFGKCLSTKSRAKQLITELSACNENEEEKSFKSALEMDFVTTDEMEGSPFMVETPIERYTKVIEDLSDIEPDEPDVMLMSLRNSINNKSKNPRHPIAKQLSNVQYVVKEKPIDFFTKRRPTKPVVSEPADNSEIGSDHDDCPQIDEESDIDDDVFQNDLTALKMRNSVLENPAESVQKSVLATLGLLKKLGTGKQDNREDLELIKKNMSKSKSSFRQPRLKKLNDLEEEVVHLDITKASSTISSDIKSDVDEKVCPTKKGIKHADQRK